MGNSAISLVDPWGFGATLYLDRSTGTLYGIDDDGNYIEDISITENGQSITPDDPYGENGVIPPGEYIVTPRPDNLNHAGRPTLSTEGQDWNTIVTPNGTIRNGVQIHPGTRSEGCPLTDPGTDDYERIQELINDDYNSGGVTIIIQE